MNKYRSLLLAILVIFTVSSTSVDGIQGDLPEKYDLRELGQVTNIRNQEKWGSCWAFATMGALESHILKTSGESIDLSENNMDMRHGFKTKGYRQGAKFDAGIPYLLRGDGPLLEEDDPYVLDLSKDEVDKQTRVEDKLPKKLVKGFKYVDDVKSNEVEVGNIDSLRDIKYSLMKYGAVSTGIYNIHDGKGRFPYENDDYYNKETSSYYYNEKADTRVSNHQVVIVGWDDNYSKDKFITKPKHNGAWICRDAQGVEFGEEGYYYVSYESRDVGKDVFCFTKVDDVKANIEILQHDKLGNTLEIREKYFNEFDGDVYFNVYDGQEGDLKEIGFYTLKNNTEYDLYFIEDFKNFQSREFLDEDTMENYIDEKKIKSGNLENAGYHTLEINPRELKSGNKFAVGLRLKGSDMAIEGSGDRLNSKNIVWDIGETFINGDSMWREEFSGGTDETCLVDFNKLKSGFNGNIILKAYVEKNDIEKLTVENIDNLEDIRVNEDEIEDIFDLVRNHVQVQLSNGENKELEVIWNWSSLNNNTGEQVLKGTLKLEGMIANPNNLIVEQKIIIEKKINKKIIDQVDRLKDMILETNKDIEKNLKEKVQVTLLNGDRVDLNIEWKKIKPSSLNSFLVIGELKLKDGIENPEKLVVEQKVIIKSLVAEDGQENVKSSIDPGQPITVFYPETNKDLDDNKLPSTIFKYPILEKDLEFISLLNKKGTINRGELARIISSLIDPDLGEDKAIENLKSKKIMIGYLDASFGENKNISRGEFIKVLDNILELKKTDKNYFKDMNKHWSRKSVNSLYELGIIKGYSLEEFNPEGYLTYEQVKLVLNRLMDFK